MPIDQKQKKTPWLNQKDQLRLLLMVAALAMVLVATNIVSEPQFWTNFFNAVAPGNKKDHGDKKEQGNKSNQRDVTKKKTDSPKINFSVQLEKENQLPDDAFRSTETSIKKKPSKTTPLASETFDISPRLLQGVKDNWIGIRSSEVNAYYTILAKVRDLSNEQIEQTVQKNISFPSLMVDSDHYRGKLIQIKGKAHRVLKFEAGSNKQNIPQLYELWIFTEDSGSNPVRIVCTTVPKGIPMGESITPVDVTVNGYFFKREGYEANKSPHVAPLILAKSFEWHPPKKVATKPKKTELAPYIIGSAVVGMLFVCLVIWRCTAGDKKFDKKLQERHAQQASESVAALQDNVEYTSLDEMFEKLKEND